MLLRYTATARALHWLTAVLIAGILGLGIWMVYFEPADHAFGQRLYDLHENLGVTVLVIAVLRLIVRFRRGAPPLPADTPRIVRLAADMNHAGLYALLLVQPALGFLATNAWGFPRVWWGILPLPSPIGRSETLAPILSTLHWLGALALVLALAAHLGGVAYHMFIRRDGLLRRML